jgi:hypothetical protein
MAMQHREIREGQRFERLIEVMITSVITIVPIYGFWSLHALPIITIV